MIVIRASAERVESVSFESSTSFEREVDAVLWGAISLYVEQIDRKLKGIRASLSAEIARIEGHPRGKEKSEVASCLGKLRWANKTKEERSAHARMMRSKVKGKP